MGTRFLIDTNILIYYIGNVIPQASVKKMNQIIAETFNISIISKIEFLGWHRYTENDYGKAVKFIRSAVVIPLKDKIIAQTISVKRKHNIKLPDAVIAATCLIDEYTLVTRNVRDFDKISGLRFYNPFAVKKLKSK